jgi:hypothetical protein
MNLDKTIKELTDRLDVVHHYSYYSPSNNELKNDGINYWKGKKIISVKVWKELYEKNSTYTDTYTITLTSRKPLQYFPDDYNGSRSLLSVIDEKLKEEIQNWNKNYYELLEYRKNPVLGRMKCSKCLLSGSNDDPIFVGIEKVFARIVSNQCNNNIANDQSHGLITYHCNILNIFSCPFENKKESYNKKEEIESIYSYKREDLFALHKISFVIEQAITTFFEITKDNEIIYETDFENDRIQEIHTKYNGEPENWGWQEDIQTQLSKVKPISNIVIRDEHDIYSILTNREKLEYLLQEYENNQLDRGQEQGCCDENTPCVPNDDEKVINSNEKKMMNVDTGNYNNNYVDSHRGENSHSKNNIEDGKLNNEKLTSNLKAQIKYELEEQEKEQQILLKQNKQTIIDFLLDNKEAIRIEDLRIYEPIYKCYREKGHCFYCNTITNIVCINCNNNNYSNNKEVWFCTNHWNQHAIENMLNNI